jgi:allophanate hydrolase
LIARGAGRAFLARADARASSSGEDRHMTFDFKQGSLDIATLRAHYQDGTLTPEQLIEALYARMEADDVPGVWIFRLPREEALRRARALGSFQAGGQLPLFGIPFGVKDNIDVAGMPTTAACPAFSYEPNGGAPAVEALLRAGALCLGKLNLDQFATGLVGTRSPHGAGHSVFDSNVLSGGSSSGSALAVANHQVSFALGTDTAGSGRVPAAFNNVVGLKPSVGSISTEGVVPACASLDCVSVFALCVEDAAAVRDLMLDRPHLLPHALPTHCRFGVPTPLELFGDAHNERIFAQAVEHLSELGFRMQPIDFAPFLELGDMLYGHSVTERQLAVGAFIEAQPEAVLPITRDIISRAKQIDPAQAVGGMKRLAALRFACLEALAEVDLLLTPTTPRPFTFREHDAAPHQVNDKLGIFTRFVNYLGCPVLSIPAGFRADGLPFGISLVGHPARDRALDALAAKLHALSGAGMGKLRHPLPAAPASVAAAAGARVAVVGAHMRGLALNGQLLECGASFVRTAHTAPSYRLFVLPNSQPERPGLVRVEGAAHAIEVEIWELPWPGLGQLMARVPPPLSIGTLALADGESVRGFLCESYATAGARDISELGGYRRYLEQKTG